jgi:GTP diphosphokinase / guanosine-3',5'-bis(diphosphate) 3'-diphosphatase
MPKINEIIDKLPSPPKKDVDLLIKAYDFALKAHEGQTRKSGEPYFLHVFQTAKKLAELSMSPTVIAAGFLHDTIEDTPATEKDIEREFGKEILDLVKGVTKLGTVRYRGVERNVENLRKFFVSIAADFRVLIIKLCDRLHNAETLQHVRPDKQRRIALETLEIYAPLANRMSMGKLRGQLEDAAFPFAYPKECELVKKLLSERKDADKEHLIQFEKDLMKKIKDEKINLVHSDYRVKHLFSLWKKLEKYEMDINKVYDIIALRVIVKTVEDCYRVLGIIHGSWKPLPGKIKDYIALPKPNGYRSLHTTVLTGTGGVVEVQIRTEEMHIEAEYGIAAHYAYKEKIKLEKADFKKQYAWVEQLRDTQKNIGDSEKFFESLKMDFFKYRVFAFTPKGDVIDLPEDASVIDFAYHVHSDVGDHASGAKINGKFVSLDTKPTNGDIVEVITQKKVKPNSKWLEYAKTSLARNRINKYLKDNSLAKKFESFLK